MSHHISEWNEPSANSKLYKRGTLSLQQHWQGCLSALKRFIHPSANFVVRICCKLTLAWSSIKSLKYSSEYGHALLYFARGSFIFNEDIDSLIPYTVYTLSLVMLKRVKFFGLPKTYCAYLILYIKVDDMLISAHFESRAFPVCIMIY